MLREAAPSRGHPWHAACPGDPPWEPTKRGGPIGGVVGPMALFPTFFFFLNMFPVSGFQRFQMPKNPKL